MTAVSADGSLYEVFREIPDPRARRGKIYPLAAVLTLASTAMLCGCRSLAAIAQWGGDYNHLAPQLGFSRRTKDGAASRTPCGSELHTVLAALPAEVFEAALTRCDYFLTVKDNQPTLESDIRAVFGPAFSPSGGIAAGDRG